MHEQGEEETCLVRQLSALLGEDMPPPVPWSPPALPAVSRLPFGIGLIVGPSGSGKSSLLKQFGHVCDGDGITWQRNKAVISHFACAEEGIARLSAVGNLIVISLCFLCSFVCRPLKFP